MAEFDVKELRNRPASICAPADFVCTAGNEVGLEDRRWEKMPHGTDGQAYMLPRIASANPAS